ncbi:unnamed protein product [Prunus armeniaca]
MRVLVDEEHLGWTLLATTLRAYAADPDLQQEWMMVKKVNKMRLAEYIEAMSGVKVSLDAMFDVHTKQIHEYKKGSSLIYLALSINMTVSSISAEKLEDILVLVHLDIHNWVKIFAQNLKYLKLSGDDIWFGQSLGKSTSLEKADLFLESNRRCFKILSEVLYSINKVETLALNRETTMVIFFPSMAIGNCQSETLYSTLTDQAVFCGDFMPLLLENVCYLSIHVGSFRDMLVPGMVSTFQGMCNMSTLEIKEGTAVEATIYVFVSASIQDIIWRFKEARSNFDELPEKSIWVGIKRGTLLATALRAYAADPDLQQEWMMVKKVNKMRLAEYIEAMSGVKVLVTSSQNFYPLHLFSFVLKVSLDAMFDVHTKQILEYKKGSCLIYLALSINMTLLRITSYLLKGAITILQHCAHLVHLLVTFGELYVFKILSEVLSSINKVETLALNRETTMVIFFPSMAIGNCQSETLYSTLTDQAVFCGDFMPLLLENVCYLSIHVGSFCDMLVPGMVSTFQGMCNLSTLEIMSDPEFFEPKTDFAKYVLEHAQNLKKMTVFHSPQQSKAVRKITKSMIASSAKLVFLEDRERGR